MYSWLKAFTILGYIALLICYGTLWADSYGDAIAIPLLIILTLVGIIIIAKTSEDSERDFLVTLFLLGFLLRVSLSTVIYNTKLYGIVAAEDDWAGYAGGAYLFYSWMNMPMPSWVPADYISSLLMGNRGYWYWAGILFYMLGSPSQMSLGYMNCFFSVLTVILIYKMAKFIFGRDSAMIAAKYAVFFPSLVIWSVLTLKEPMILFLECLIMYSILHLKKGKWFNNLLILIPALFILWTMRFYIFYIVVAVIVFSFFPIERKVLIPSLFFYFAVVGMIIILTFKGGIWKSDAESILSFNLEYVKSLKSAYASPEYGSGVLLSYTPTLWGTLLFLPIGFVYVMLSPFPWQLIGGTMRMKLSFPDTLLWWWMIPTIIYSLIYAIKNNFRAIQPLLFFLISNILVYSLLFGNTGVAFRQRLHVIAFALILFGYGKALKQGGEIEIGDENE